MDVSKPVENSLRSIRIAIMGGTLALAIVLPLRALGAPIEYRISGLLTGDLVLPLSLPVNLTGVPFVVAIAADAENAFEFGPITGFGTAYVNMGTASWTVDGVGSAYSLAAQVYSLPAVGRIGFGWNGEIYPLNTTQPAERHFQFLGGPFATDPSYGQLDAPVAPTSLSLMTELRNPPNSIPEYSTSINFSAQGQLILKDLTSLSYSVVAIPEPSTAVLLMLGFAGLSGVRFRRRVMCCPTGRRSGPP